MSEPPGSRWGGPRAAGVARRRRRVGLANHTVLDRTAAALNIASTTSAAPDSRFRRGRRAAPVLVFRDISERRQVEDALREADRRKDEFLAMLASRTAQPISAPAAKRPGTHPARVRHESTDGGSHHPDDGAPARSDGAPGARPAGYLAHDAQHPAAWRRGLGGCRHHHPRRLGDGKHPDP